MTKIAGRAVAGAAMLVVALAARAVPVHVDFSGHLTGLGGSAFGSQFSIGDGVTGSFDYESDTPDVVATPTQGTYNGVPTNFSAMVSTGGGPIIYTSTGANHITVLFQSGLHRAQFVSLAVSGPALTTTGTGPASMQLFYNQSTLPLPLSSDALLTDFGSAFTVSPSFMMNFGISGVTNVIFTVDSARYSSAGGGGSAPEPASVALLLPGLVLVLAAARGRRAVGVRSGRG